MKNFKELRAKISAFLLFSNGNTINNTVNINSEDYTFDKLILLLKEKWENCIFSEVIEMMKEIKVKPKNEDNIIKYLLFEANLYLSIEEFGKVKDIIELLDKKYSEKAKFEIDYYKLKYFLFLEEDIKEILETQFSLSISELEWEVLYFNKKYDEFFLKSEELNLIKNIKYMILKLEKASSVEEIKVILEYIKKDIENKSILEKIKILEKAIDILTNNINLSARIKFSEYFLLYIEIFEKSIQVRNFLKNDFEKKIINTYLIAKGSFINKVEFLLLLREYSNYLSETNKIRLLIIENKGYKTLADSLYKNKNLEGLNMVFFILFIEAKYKYILQLFRKIDFSISENLYIIRIYSKIMLKRKIIIEELTYLKENKNKNDTIFLCYNLLLFQNGEIEINNLKEVVMGIISKNKNDEILNLIILRAIYLIDWFWIVNIFIKEKKEYEYLISEIIRLISDSKINGYHYGKIIEQLVEDKGNYDYELIGTIYIEYKNFNKGLEYLYKSWSEKKTLKLAKKIMYVLFMKNEGDQKIYEYLKSREETKEDKIRNIFFLYLVDNKRGTIELNNFLLSFPSEYFNEILYYIQKLYYHFLLKDAQEKAELYFENSIYVKDNMRYIPNVYLEFNKKKYSLMNKEDFDIYKLEDNKNFQDLKITLLKDLIRGLGGIKNKIPGIIGFDIANIKDNPQKIIEKLGEISGASKYQKERKKYLDLNSSKTLLYLYHNFYELEDFMIGFIKRFNKEYVNKAKFDIELKKNKILAPDSILLLYKLKLLEILNYDETLLFQKTTYEFFKKEIAYYEDARKIIKVLKNFPERIIDDKNINELIRSSEIKDGEVSHISRIFYSIVENNADYITEDRNLKLPSRTNSYSSLSLVFLNKLNYNLDYTEFDSLIRKLL